MNRTVRIAMAGLGLCVWLFRSADCSAGCPSGVRYAARATQDGAGNVRDQGPDSGLHCEAAEGAGYRTVRSGRLMSADTVWVYSRWSGRKIRRRTRFITDTNMTEILYILKGSADLITGGTIPDARPPARAGGNYTGTKIVGGTSRHVVPGDVIITPGRTPHLWANIESDMSYLVFRPDPDGKLPLK